MALSLRTRLIVWYAALLLLAIGLFSATVLWLHWRLLMRQADESLEAFGLAAANVVSAELDEHATLGQAAREMASGVRHDDFVVTVLDAGGAPIHELPVALPIDAAARDLSPRTVTGPGGRAWRMALRSGGSGARAFTVVIAAPLSELEDQWRTLVEACAIGVPFVMAL